MDPKRAHYNLTFAILAISGIAFALLQSLVAPALRTIQTDLHTTTTTVAWVFTGYLLSASVATPIVGRLGDMFGKKRMLVVTLAIVAAGTLVAALATSIDVLILGRVIQGAGGAIFPLAFAIIRDEFPHERVPTGIALISALLGVGGGLGIVLAGPIVAHFSITVFNNRSRFDTWHRERLGLEFQPALLDDCALKHILLLQFDG